MCRFWAKSANNCPFFGQTYMEISNVKMIQESFSDDSMFRLKFLKWIDNLGVLSMLRINKFFGKGKTV
jgi:hypothetical protein